MFFHVFGDRCNYETSMIETNTLCSYTTYFLLFLIARISCDPWNTKIIQETENPFMKLCPECFFFLIQIQNWNIFHLPTLCILWIVSEISAAMERFSCRSCLVFIFCELTTSELLPKIVFCILMTFKLPSWINISRSQKLTKWNFIIVHKA